MKIATVNLPVSYIEAIESLVGVLYPSRSEFIRCAFRDLLRKKMEERPIVLPDYMEQYEESDHEKCIRLCKETIGDDINGE